MTRVYVSATPDDLAGLRDAGVLTGGDRFTAPDDSEESEYAALMAAADASTALGPRGGRRVVVVAELPDEDAPVAPDDVVALHLDTADRGPDADPDEDLEWFAPQELAHL
jgi:hypothetical protein